MCAITGMVSSEIGGADIERVKFLNKALSHRGPDGEGIWVDPSGIAIFGHRRLAILDLSADAKQPMISSDGKYVISYNGEIYNFCELQSQLENKGYSFRTKSDTEVILASWQAWGEKMLDRFNGMWSLAIWDIENRKLFLSRDRFGVKPLFYYCDKNSITFSSELYPLKNSVFPKPEYDKAIIGRLLVDPFSVEASISTLFKNIHRLLPGHCAVWKSGKMEIKRWWRTTDHLISVPSNWNDREEKFRELFFDSIRIRMRSDVPIGTCLSGGFDSTAVASTMLRMATESQRTRGATVWRHAFVATFPGKDNDERPQAEEASAYVGITPTVVEIRDENALENIEQILGGFDDVYIGLPSAIWMLYRELRRENVLVTLDGHGADELMGAYRSEAAGIGYQLRKLFGSLFSRGGSTRRMADILRRFALAAGDCCYLREGWQSVGNPLDLVGIGDPLPKEWGLMNRHLYHMFHATVLPTILRNYDRLSMAHGIEVRMPFMDWRLVSYVMSLPDSCKSNNDYTKVIARRSLHGIMPESIRTMKKKVGFNSPMPSWLNGPLSEWVLNVMSGHVSNYDDIVDTPRILAQINRLTSQKRWDWRSAGRLWPYIQLRWNMKNNI